MGNECFRQRTYPLQLALQPSSNSSCLRTLRIKRVHIKKRRRKRGGGGKRADLGAALSKRRANAILPGFTLLPQRRASPQG